MRSTQVLLSTCLVLASAGSSRVSFGSNGGKTKIEFDASGSGTPVLAVGDSATCTKIDGASVCYNTGMANMLAEIEGVKARVLGIESVLTANGLTNATDHAGAISTNAGAHATNAGGISTNAGSISTNAGGISTNVAGITSSHSTLQNNIDTISLTPGAKGAQGEKGMHTVGAKGEKGTHVVGAKGEQGEKGTHTVGAKGHKGTAGVIVTPIANCAPGQQVGNSCNQCSSGYEGADCNTLNIDGGLIAKYTMDGNGADSSGSGMQYDATQNGGSFAAGRQGQAYSVSSCNHMEVNGLRNYVWGSDFSVCTWFKRTSNDGNYQGIISTGYGGDYPTRPDGGVWEIRMGRENSGQNVGGTIWPQNDASLEWSFHSLTAPLNQWNHVCMTWDGSTSNYYLNGNLAGSNTADSGPIPSVPNPVFIGYAGPGTNPGTPECFTGLIDNVRLYSRAVTATDVAAMNNGGL